MATKVRRHRQNLYRRGPPTREPYDTVLIVCEGEKTEPNYFNGLITTYRLSSANVRIASPGAAPRTVVEHAKERLKEFQGVYCVFDGDTDQVEAAVREIRMSSEGKAGQWHAIVSTPCFEVWLGLHFKYSTSSIVGGGGLTAGDAAVKVLKAHIPDYKKGHRSIFPLLHDRLPQALANAKKLRRFNEATSSRNPATDVHLLVDYLCKLKPP
jgi:hypothetical protein